MKKTIIVGLLILMLAMMLTGYAEELPEEKTMMQMKINDTPVTVTWEENESVDALKELAQNGLTIRMSMYGGFEQVGPIGQRLPRQDVQTSTSSGDIVLYSGNQLVVFYGSNSWAYTRLGHIDDKTPDEMRKYFIVLGIMCVLAVWAYSKLKEDKLSELFGL